MILGTLGLFQRHVCSPYPSVLVPMTPHFPDYRFTDNEFRTVGTVVCSAALLLRAALLLCHESRSVLRMCDVMIHEIFVHEKDHSQPINHSQSEF